MYSIPNSLENILLSYIKRTYLPKGHANPKTADQFTYHDIKFFARGAAEMSAYFTSERAHLPKNYFNKKELRAGYLLYFVMTNFLKVKFCLEQIGALDSRFHGNDNIIRILDLGCGPGTASLACADHFRERKIEITAIDQNTHSLHDAKHLFKKFAGDNATLKTLFHYINKIPPFPPLQKGGEGGFNLIIAANFFSELGDVSKQSGIVETLLHRHLAPNGIIIIIEPALRWTTRNLMKLRDNILQLKHLNTQTLTHCISPCLHNSPCPMLRENNRDWCHMYLDWQRPKVIEEVDKLIGNRKDYLKFSYLILSKHETRSMKHDNPPSPPFEKGGLGGDLFRAVSSPMRSKGKIEMLLCGQDGRILRATRQDKNISENNQDLDTTMRGDLIETDSRGSIEKNTRFKRIY